MRPRTTVGVVLRGVVAAGVLVPLVGALLATAVFWGVALGFALAGFASYAVEFSVQLLLGCSLVGVVGVLYGGTKAALAEVRAGRRRWLEGAEPAAPDEHGRLVGTVDRLARTASLPAPAVRVRETPTPLAYTVHRRDGPVLVASTGLLDRLPRDELTAVLAHEVAHLANRDGAWMTRALLPLAGAEELHETFVDEDDLDDPRTWPYWLAGELLVAWGTVGATVFARGREYAADEGAAALTGDPAALAAALERLSEDAPEPPPEDLRAHARSVDALNVLPSLDPDDEGGLLGTHPPTGERIRRLRALAADRET